MGWRVLLGIQGEIQPKIPLLGTSLDDFADAIELHQWEAAKKLRTDGADIHASYPQGTTVLVRVLEYHFEKVDYIFGPIKDLCLSPSELVYVLQSPFLSEMWLETELLSILERSVEKIERGALKVDLSASISPARTNSIEFALKYQLLSAAAKNALLSTACKLGEERYEKPRFNNDVWEPFSTLDSVESLLQDQADPNVLGEDMMGPLHHACQRGLYYHASSLLNRGAKFLAGPDQFRPIHFVARGSRNPGLDVPIANLLIDNGADLTAQTADGSNALSLAVGSGNLGMVQYLLGKSPSLANKDGDYPLHIACLHGFESIVSALLDENPNLEDMIDSISPCHGSPLYIAAEKGYLNISKSLVDDAGADVNLASSHHDSLGPPLFAACAKGHGEVVKLLLLHKAKITTEFKGLRFNSAIQVCEAFSQPGMKWILRHPPILRH